MSKGFRVIFDPGKLEFLLPVLVFSYAWFIGSLIYELWFNGNGEWFSRSGSILCVAGVIVDHRLSQTPDKLEVTCAIANSNLLRKLVTHPLNETEIGGFIKSASVVGAAIGAIIWGYGDLLI